MELKIIVWYLQTIRSLKEYGNHINFSYYSLNSKNIWKSKKGMTLKDKHPRSVCIQYITREKQRNSSRRNEEAEQKCKWYTVVDVSGGESKVQWYKEQYCIKPGMLGP